MPKKKKTLKQKVRTDLKRQSSLTQSANEQHEATFSLPQTYFEQSKQVKNVVQSRQAPKTITIATHEYAYLGKDLLKTLFLTGSIIILEILIRYVVERG